MNKYTGSLGYGVSIAIIMIGIMERNSVVRAIGMLALILTGILTNLEVRIDDR